MSGHMHLLGSELLDSNLSISSADEVTEQREREYYRLAFGWRYLEWDSYLTSMPVCIQDKQTRSSADSAYSHSHRRIGSDPESKLYRRCVGFDCPAVHDRRRDEFFLKDSGKKKSKEAVHGVTVTKLSHRQPKRGEHDNTPSKTTCAASGGTTQWAQRRATAPRSGPPRRAVAPRSGPRGERSPAQRSGSGVENPSRPGRRPPKFPQLFNIHGYSTEVLVKT
ncbi:hypothetical protein R3P38DRAFT_2769798 [Favolaschia claudopus]|uniref:Uncharacterized protein n=1 Tax=Favolaschia claudopus TaxID=2862362 RepID=A0AAW0CMJ5_9AGAR